MRTAVLILIAVAALADWWSRLPHEHRWAARVEQVGKPLTTLLVIALAATADAPGSQAVIAVVALVCCLTGDVVLMEPIDSFVGGLAAFLLAHLVFIALFVRFGVHHSGLALIAAAGGLVVAVAVGRPILVAARRSQPSLTVPVSAYLVVIISMAVFGWATGRVWAIIGSTTFVLSDAALGWEAFVAKRRFLPLAVMMTYHGAIVALALSL